MSRGRLLVILIAVIGLLYWSLNVKSIQQVTGVDLQDVTKIVFYDGRGGRFAPVTLEDKQKVTEFIRFLEKYRVKRIKNVEPMIGWIHSANLYIGDKEVLKITFVDPMIINGEYYSIAIGKLSTRSIDDFLESVEGTER